jgi:hypothetical protein
LAKEGLVISGQSYDFKSEFVKDKSIQTIRILGFTEGKWIDRVFWLNLYLFKSLELISRKKWPPGPEAAVPRAN